MSLPPKFLLLPSLFRFMPAIILFLLPGGRLQAHRHAGDRVQATADTRDPSIMKNISPTSQRNYRSPYL